MNLKLKNCFTMKFNDTEILIPKDNVTFQDGFAIVHAKYNILFEKDGEAYYTDEPLVGIINSRYQTVLDLVPAYILPTIEFFKNRVIVLKYKDNFMSREGNDYSVFRCETYNGKIINHQDLQANSFTKINHSVIKLDSVVSESGVHLYALYDVSKNVLLTPYYHQISDFQVTEDCPFEIALATYVTVSADHKPVEIICYINKNGKVVSNFQNLTTGKVYDLGISLTEIVDIVSKEDCSIGSR